MKIKNPILNQIWQDRYCKENETLDANLHRVAKYCSKNGKEENEFYDIMNEGLFFPAGRTMSNAGIGQNLTLNNCFNLNNVPDSIADIFDYIKYGALTQKAGGGTGYNFSLIRPNGTPTSNDAVASGVVSFMNAFNSQTHTILQGGRRGANMGILLIYHPDIFEYLESKSWDEGKLVHFNLSVMVDDDFIKAKNNDEYIYLHYPCMTSEGRLIKDESKWQIKKKVKAKKLWDLIMKKAYDTGEYGVFFYENLNKDNNLWYMENITGTNPCGEYVSGILHGKNPKTKEKINPLDYMGACNLGSLFLHNFVRKPFTKDVYIDYNELNQTISIAVKILDNIIDINKFPLKQFENYQKNVRTIGLGFTGLADLLTMFNLKYGSKEAINFTDKITNYITKQAYKVSIELAKEKGQFPFLNREKFIQSNFIQKHISKDKEWLNIANDILKYGIRNGRLMSVAPTGTLSLTFGQNCSSGLEPIFSLEYDRKVKIGGQDDKDIQIVKMRDNAYDKWLEFKDNKDCIVKKDIFITAMELPVKAHINMLQVIAFNTDMSCSKTINIPTDYLFEDTKQVYMDCWEKGIKGCTIFRPNPLRQGILITNNKKENEDKKTLKRGEWKSTAKDTIYTKRKIYTGCGKINLFIGWSDTEQTIQDLYIKRNGQGGCERSLDSTIIGMSGMLRLGGSLFNIEKALDGLGTCPSFATARAKGKKISKGNSCGMAILNEIKSFLKEKTKVEQNSKENNNSLLNKPKKEKNNKFSLEENNFLKENGEIAFAKQFNKCPICGEQLENSGGCIICNKGCGWSKCE